MLTFLKNLLRALRATTRSGWAKFTGPDTRLPERNYSHTRQESNHIAHARVYFGRHAFNRIVSALSSATRSIDLQTFIWRADEVGLHVARLMVEAADRGVRVTIRKEMTGDIFEFANDFAGTARVDHSVWSAFWHHPLITIHHENAHDHSKVCIVDEELMLVASMNIGEQDCLEWHECLVEIRGADRIAEYRKGDMTFPTLTAEGQIKVFHSTRAAPMLPVVLELIRRAKRSIRIEMAYFSDPAIIELLAKKSHEGVFVLLILPHSADLHHHANIAAATTLLNQSKRNRMFVVRYPKEFLHTKMILVDRKTLFIGSTNLIASSLSTMGEANVLIHRHPRRCLRVVRRKFIKDLLKSDVVKPSSNSALLWHSMLSTINL